MKTTYDILVRPLITEKTMKLVEEGKYTFEVKQGSNKVEVKKAVEEIKAGKVEYRVDKAGNIATIVGKASFDAEKLVENIKVINNVLMKAKPQTVKGVYVKNISIATTMGPGIKVDPATI